MFRASLQRQVRLGHAARQLSTASLRRTAPSEHLTVLRQTQQPPPALRHLLPKPAFPRLYSVESAAAQANREGEFAAVPSALVTRFAEMDRLDVHKNLIEAITKGMGYDAMTEVQSMTINSALKGVDMVAQAKTGTGKTLAFLVPLFQRVLVDQPELADSWTRRRASSEDIRAIILSPTRELAEQIGTEARKLAKNTNIVIQTAVGGTRKREALQRMWREGCDILVATPGRLNDLLTDPEARVAAPNLKAFVLDEADRMLDVGFSDEIRTIQKSLPSRKEVDRQTLLFSATIPRDVVHLAKSMVRPDNFEFVQTIKSDDVPTHERVPQHLVTIQGFENIYPTILEILEKGKAAETAELPFKAMIFFSNTASVQLAHEAMRQTSMLSRSSGISTFEIHSRLTQAQRTRSADYFRRARSAILFTSDVTARGMDFPNVTDVIQIGLPPDRDQYIHRVGRTGRAGSSGKGWLILTPPEVQEARGRLGGLPIKPNDTLESAKHDALGAPPADNVARFFSEVTDAYPTVPKSYIRAMYLGTLGQKFGRYFQAGDVVGLLNRWTKAIGWAEPPAVSPKIAQNRGLTRIPGIRIGHDPVEDDEPMGGDSFGSRSGFQRNSGFGRGGFQRDSGRSGFQRDSGRGGFQRDSSRGGFQRDSSRGGFQRDSGSGGFQRGSGGGGFQRGSGGGGFQRDSGRGGFQRNNDSGRGGFQRNNNSGRGGGRSNSNDFEGRFSSRTDEGGSSYPRRSSF